MFNMCKIVGLCVNKYKCFHLQLHKSAWRNINKGSSENRKKYGISLNPLMGTRNIISKKMLSLRGFCSQCIEPKLTPKATLIAYTFAG